MSIATEVTRRTSEQRAARRRPTLFDAIRWETSKLAAQARARVTLLICLIAPVLIVIVINGSSARPRIHCSAATSMRAGTPCRC
jgi:ABC-2 type transport system permease protein